MVLTPGRERVHAYTSFYVRIAISPHLRTRGQEESRME